LKGNGKGEQVIYNGFKEGSFMILVNLFEELQYYQSKDPA